jgi:MATE family multidrug resistance protein
MVDIAIAGHLSSSFGSAALIGGIAVGTMLFDLLYWNFAFLRTGTGGLTAQAYGASSSFPDLSRESLTGPILLRALRIALLSGLALIAVQWLVVNGAFLVVKCTPEVRTLASQYFYIRIWAAPATLSLFAFKGWFIGMQDSVRPMTADLLVNGINIAASFLLALGIPGIFDGIGFPGIALGTVIAQWSGLVYCIFSARRRYFVHGFGLFGGQTGKNGNLSTENGGFFSLNRDLFLRSVGMIAVYIGFTVISARFGDMMLAVSTILMKLLMIFSYFTDGFAYAGEALTGRFIGERSKEGVLSTVKQTFAWSGGVALLFMALYGLGGTWLFSLMTSDAAVVDAGRQFLPWLLMMPLVGCPAFVWDGIYIGATAGNHLRNSTLLCAVGFFAVWFIGRIIVPSATPETAIHILMGAYFTHLVIRSVYLSLTFSGISTQVQAE